jgi:DNA end-binding protein Ku
MAGKRATWCGDIQIGLIAVPVKVYTATTDLDPQFNQLHNKCNHRINKVNRCNVCKEDVPNQDIVKGYEDSKDHYVPFTKEELLKLEDETSNETMEVTSFVDPNTMDINLWYKSYWVSGGGKTSKSFVMLHKAMSEMGLGALCKVKLRSKMRWGLLQPVNNLFSLALLRFGDEIVAQSEIQQERNGQAPSDREVALTKRLIGQMVSTFDVSDYKNTYRTRVDEVAKTKADVQPHIVIETDLCGLLEKSLQ